MAGRFTTAFALAPTPAIVAWAEGGAFLCERNEAARTWPATQHWSPGDWSQLAQRVLESAENDESDAQSVLLRLRWRVATVDGQILAWLMPLSEGADPDFDAVRDQFQLVSERLSVVQEFGRLAVSHRDIRRQIAHWDVHWFRLFGFDPAGGVPNNEALLARVHPDDLERVKKFYFETMRTAGRYEMRWRMVHPDGKVVRCHGHWEVKNGPDGLPERLVAVALDDTESVRAAQSQMASSLQLGLAVGLVGISLWRIELATQRIHLNDWGFELVGLRPRSDGMPVGEMYAFIHPDDRDAVERADAAAVERGDVVDAEARHRRTDGSYRLLLTRRMLEHDDQGRALALIGISLDITDLRRADDMQREKLAAEQANLAKSAFLASMSHELRTPLNAILGYAELLRKDKLLGERAESGLTTIQQSGEHLLMLINDILDLSRIEAGKLELHPDEVEIMAMLNAVSDTIRIAAQQKDLAFTLDVGGELPPVVVADAKRLRQVLLNLLGNAVKFTDAGSVTLRATRLPGGQNAQLRFDVEDTGVGIAPEHLQAVFLPFEQVGDLRRRLGGTGLGLAISQHLARCMGGDISVASTPGQGSRFSFSLEAPIGKPAVQPRQPNSLVTGYAGRRREVLVVDDIAGNRAVAKDYLRSVGFVVREAEDGKAALSSIRAQPPDIVLMDALMPVMDGLSATQLLRDMPGHERLPVIVLSAGASGIERTKSLKAGADVFLSKPVDFEALLDHIGSLLQLEWVREAAPGSTDGKVDGKDARPAAQDIEELFRLARIGNMASIRAYADALAKRDLSQAAFASQVSALAAKFESRALMELIAGFRSVG